MKFLMVVWEKMNTEIPVISDPVKLTEFAAETMKNVLKEENLDGYAVRIGVIGGGCSGLQYMMDFVEGSKDNLMEMEYEDHGVKIVIDYFSAAHLVGTTIDYQDSLMATGFKFNNPNKDGKSCGCGKSFQY